MPSIFLFKISPPKQLKSQEWLCDPFLSIKNLSHRHWYGIIKCYFTSPSQHSTQTTQYFGDYSGRFGFFGHSVLQLWNSHALPWWACQTRCKLYQLFCVALFIAQPCHVFDRGWPTPSEAWQYLYIKHAWTIKIPQLCRTFDWQQRNDCRVPKQAGYYTVLSGKWHLGKKAEH